MSKKFVIDNKELITQWDYSKNKNYDPSKISYGSTIKVWWICNKKHEWEQSPNGRIKKDKIIGCPYCSNQKFKSGYNDLETMNPDLTKEWNTEKNKIKASEVLYGGDTKYWWKCNKGHEWQTSIIVRKVGNNCPYCSKYQSVVTIDDSFGTLFPELMKEWDYSKNIHIDPYDIRTKTKLKVWWICPKGHEYYSTIQHRSNGVGCPYCYRENQTSFPEQVVYYYIKLVFPDALNRYKMDSVEIDIYIPSLKLGIEYDGIHFHKGQKSVDKEINKLEFLKERGIQLLRIKEDNLKNLIDNNIVYYQYSNHHTNLPNAINNLSKLVNNIYQLNIKINVNLDRDRTNILESYMETEKENSIKTKYPEIAKEWNYEKNGKLKPEYFKYSSNKKVWWICSKGHEWQMSPNARTFGQKCPYCSSRKILKGYNDFGSLYPKIAKEWNTSKNGKLTPYDVMPMSSKRVWWICSKGHEWQTSIQTRTAGSNCPYCAPSQNKVCKDNCLVTINPVLAKEWNYEKNDISPYDIRPGSNKKVWWKCSECGREWEAVIKSRNKGLNSGCPMCNKKSMVETKEKNNLIKYGSIKEKNPELALLWNYEKNDNLTPEMISITSGKAFWWKCNKCQHEWKRSVNSSNRSTGCPKCSYKEIGNKISKSMKYYYKKSRA